ncbi:type II toxin-antitoxin system VapC family toxin [Candidatus Collierbacteria bacterium]|nr:type II toxin-antitoxin system VapC family toxin [Candidatus Collierbacteria bacterium]
MGKKTKLVIDSSVMVKWVNSQEEKHLVQADKLAIDCKQGKVKLLAPELAKYEVGNALWKKKLDLPKAKVSLATIFASPVEFIKQDELQAMRTMEIALDKKITFYDASFLSLAESTSAALVTDNPKHQKKFSGVKVISLKDY